MQVILRPVYWTQQFNGQSPGDLENKNNGFAGRFMGYDSKLLVHTAYLNTHNTIKRAYYKV